MINGSAFQELGAVIDELEAREMTVLDVLTERSSLADSQRLSAEITVGLNSLSELSEAENVNIVPCETTDPDGLVTTTFTVEVQMEAAATAAQERSDDTTNDHHQSTTAPGEPQAADAESNGDEQDDVPYYKNYDLLARVYDEHDTFAEMTAALDVDVTPATVREHMVNLGIHPTTPDDSDSVDTDGSDGQDTSDVEMGGEDDQSVTIEADGYGLPDSITMDSLVRAVQQSRTLYEAQTALGLDRSTTREILTDLNLLDLVTSRLTADHTTELEEVIDRVHAASTT